MSTATRTDYSGNKYIVPSDKADLFDELFADYVNQPIGTVEYYEAEERFHNECQQYFVPRATFDIISF